MEKGDRWWWSGVLFVIRGADARLVEKGANQICAHIGRNNRSAAPRQNTPTLTRAEAVAAAAGTWKEREREGETSHGRVLAALQLSDID